MDPSYTTSEQPVAQISFSCLSATDNVQKPFSSATVVDPDGVMS